MDILKFIFDEGLIMIPTLYVLGMFMKDSKKLPDWTIPFILLFISLILTPLLIGGFTAENIVQGILVTGAAVLGDQLVKQYSKGGK
ncbi:phage holin family protein [Marinilactibacillus sp. XAAS-LB27]|uniref:phage holin family protein n=1 Tax=Marinilactibacillus sp. XAAS-LB27 TaxID=3114538 RepID=UPI002E18125D|nr:phage holin family protein [Marinilactibacillus sp. XAAS-LB27]